VWFRPFGPTRDEEPKRVWARSILNLRTSAHRTVRPLGVPIGYSTAAKVHARCARTFAAVSMLAHRYSDATRVRRTIITRFGMLPESRKSVLLLQLSRPSLRSAVTASAVVADEDYSSGTALRQLGWRNSPLVWHRLAVTPDLDRHVSQVPGCDRDHSRRYLLT
jgi:hypothetical protein